MDNRREQSWVSMAAAVVALTVGVSFLPAAGLPARFQDARLQAEECERKGQWTEACAWYDQLLKSHRGDADVKARLQLCLRHANQLRRHRDPSFLKAIAGRRLSEALDAYEEVLLRLQANYVERDRIHPASFFQHGLHELRFALADEAFVREYLNGVPSAKVRSFVRQLEDWPVKEMKKVRDVREEVRGVALAAVDALGLNPTPVVMEFAWGAGNSLDEYTLLLTPSQFSYLQASLRGEVVGVGLRAGVVEQKLIVGSVVANSPAGEKGLKPGDRILHIDGQSTDGWTADTASARLQGRIGSSVDLEVLCAGDPAPRALRLVRQAVLLPSVEWEADLREGIGYIRILSFQDTTVQELKDALLHLQSARMKALVLDLRGNPGGLFPAAVQVAELFLAEGTITRTESPLRKFRQIYRAHNASALTLPLVVLIDGETASAAEVLAGALKENQRATLVGAPTCGKGSIQCPVALESIPAGIWITVARFFSPRNQPYNGRGVTPHILEEVDGMDAQRNSAWRAAQQLVMMPR